MVERLTNRATEGGEMKLNHFTFNANSIDSTREVGISFEFDGANRSIYWINQDEWEAIKRKVDSCFQGFPPKEER